MDINKLLQATVELRSSDLHLIAGTPPMIRIDGELLPLDGTEVLTANSISELLKNVLTSQQLSKLSVDKEIDYSLAFSDQARFRVNAYNQKGSMAAAFRRIPTEIPHIETLGIPKVIHSLTSLRQGLVLVTGPTGHGKSTSLAALLNEINKQRACHILTIEDPVEFIFKPERSIISQREMNSDTFSWTLALRSALREDPDVVLVGEMRDKETIASALTVAETGHLVFATLHTNSAAQTIDRIVDVFPEEQQTQVKLQLSNVIEAVFSQRLIRGLPKGRVLAGEVMLGTPAIRTSIREGKTHMIDGIIETSHEAGMITLEQSLAGLVKAGKTTLETAISWSLRPELLTRLIK